MPTLGPRLVVGGTHSGVGKTTVATGLMGALARRGLHVGGAKVGPDFIDTGYHAVATGRPGRNLDPWMCGMDSLRPLAARAASGCDVLIVEGVMGLFDGAADHSASSTAEVALALEAPVVLVVDASSTSTSAAATVLGFTSFDPRLRLAGIVINRAMSDSHEEMVRNAVADLPVPVPVLGVLRRDEALVWRDRHLGLVPVVEHPEAVAASLDRLSATIARSCDLDAMVSLSRRAPAIEAGEPELPRAVAKARIAVASGPAFSFSYVDNLEALGAAGAEVVAFDPCADRSLPEGTTGLLAGGGFPEVYADVLSDNRPLLDDVRTEIASGMPVWAECGGLLWMCDSLVEGSTGRGSETATTGSGPRKRTLVGALGCVARLTSTLNLGYREATTTVATPLGPAGQHIRGHEYHYSRVDPPGSALTMTGRNGTSSSGFGTERMLASYLHVHLGARPDIAEHFVRACGRPRPALPY